MDFESFDLEPSDEVTFAPVLKGLRFEALPAFVSAVRTYGHRSTGAIPPSSNLQSFECKIDPKISCGSYHVVITLSFIDQRSWVLKVPAKGVTTVWSPALAQALESEAQTMCFLHRETTIPLPKIHAFDSTVDNDLGCPFVLMEKVEGRPLYNGWFDTKSSPAKG